MRTLGTIRKNSCTMKKHHHAPPPPTLHHVLLLTTTLTLLLHESIPTANAVLPPGYEDSMHCPPSTCKFYNSHRPSGFAGPLSSFYKCLDPSSGRATEGIWTGALTNVTAPDGWIEEPAECTDEEAAAFMPSCPEELDEFQILDESATLYYSIATAYNTDNNNSSTANKGVLCARLEYEGEAWLSIAVPSKANTMIGSQAIIGLPDDNSVLKYDLNGKDQNMVLPMEEGRQTLRDASIIQEDGRTILTFTKLLKEEGENEIGSQGVVNFLHARGSDNALGYHAVRMGFELDLSTITTEDIYDYTDDNTIDMDGIDIGLDFIMECDSDSDCSPTIRSRVPNSFNTTGVDMCECYALSTVLDPPFDECEGDDNCPTARCRADDCEGWEAYCQVEERACALRETVVTTTEVPAVTVTTEVPDVTTEENGGKATDTVIVVGCQVDKDCIPTMRDSVPMDKDVTGVNTCGCYANSVNDPFDECEGEFGCPMAMCLRNSCEGMEAYCLGEDGRCALRETVVVPDDIITDNTTMECTVDDDCEPVIRSKIPLLDIVKTGVELCNCYANSLIESFDECEGEDKITCQVANCAGFACRGMEAYCQVEEGKCALREETFVPDDGNTTDTIILVPCDVDDDCFPKMRERVPMENDITGVGTCGCYANSLTAPFDECEGDADETCPIAGCMENSCRGMEAYCEPTVGICTLRPQEKVPDIGDNQEFLPDISVDNVADKIEVHLGCTVDDDCSPVIRSEIPSPVTAKTGVDLCECYSNSLIASFDECEGEDRGTCQVATCDGFACRGMEAYCQVESGLGKCALREETFIPVDGNTTDTIILVPCDVDEDCFPKLRERVPMQNDKTGVGTCGCYANSLNDPFDECEGDADETCPIAGCMENSCRGMEAYCQVEDGTCALRPDGVPDVGDNQGNVPDIGDNFDDASGGDNNGTSIERDPNPTVPATVATTTEIKLPATTTVPTVDSVDDTKEEPVTTTAPSAAPSISDVEPKADAFEADPILKDASASSKVAGSGSVPFLLAMFAFNLL